MDSAYDELAWFYDRYWAGPFQNWQMPAIERLLLSRVPNGVGILDLCCGTGHLARALVQRGFQVTGVDGSAEMLRHAARNAPSARFLHARASSFSIEQPVSAAVCTFDSINHILSLAEVTEAFRSVRSALQPGGSFLCDINTGEAYGERWNTTWNTVQPDHAFFVRGNYDPFTKIGATEITMYRFQDEWRRSEAKVLQRCYSKEEIRAALIEAGFETVESYSATEDLRLEGHFGIGRVYLLACTPPNGVAASRS